MTQPRGKPVDMKLAMQNPSRVFSGPEEVVGHADLLREEKIAILRRWEYDARDMEVADEEGMRQSDCEENLLRRILSLLVTLDAPLNGDTSTPMKQGRA